MSTAARAPLHRAIEQDVPVPAAPAHPHDATIGALERDVRHLETVIRALTRELTRAIDAAPIAEYQIKDGRVLALGANGAAYELREVAITRPGEAGYELAWLALPPVPGSGAAIARAALDRHATHAASERTPPRAGMAVVGDGCDDGEG